MIIGIHSRDNDLVVNPIKTKKLTNIRAAGKDDAILLTPPIQLTLEYAVEFIADDELVEVTPLSIRIRKRFLKEQDRKRAARASDRRHRLTAAPPPLHLVGAGDADEAAGTPRACARRSRKRAGHAARDHRDAALVHAARRHALVHGVDHHAHAARLEHLGRCSRRSAR